jgi:hypothetical protein
MASEMMFIQPDPSMRNRYDCHGVLHAEPIGAIAHRDFSHSGMPSYACGCSPVVDAVKCSSCNRYVGRCMMPFCDVCDDCLLSEMEVVK